VYPPIDAPPILDGPVLNPEPARRTEGAQRLAAELLDSARALPDPAAQERLTKLAGGLHSLDPLDVSGDDARLAFWINVYNALAIQAHLLEKTRGNLLFKLGLFSRAAWRVGAWRYSLNLIEHGLLRGNGRVPPLPFRAAKSGDPRLAAAPARLDPRIHFALNCGARSCPPIRHYLSGQIGEQLDTATASYFATESSLDRASRTLTLPRLMKYPVDFARKHVAAEDAVWLRENRAQIRFAPYDWTIAR
jgi:hypothetical protein